MCKKNKLGLSVFLSQSLLLVFLQFGLCFAEMSLEPPYRVIRMKAYDAAWPAASLDFPAAGEVTVFYALCNGSIYQVLPAADLDIPVDYPRGETVCYIRQFDMETIAARDTAHLTLSTGQQLTQSESAEVITTGVQDSKDFVGVQEGDYLVSRQDTASMIKVRDHDDVAMTSHEKADLKGSSDDQRVDAHRETGGLLASQEVASVGRSHALADGLQARQENASVGENQIQADMSQVSTLQEVTARSVEATMQRESEGVTYEQPPTQTVDLVPVEEEKVAAIAPADVQETVTLTEKSQVIMPQDTQVDMAILSEKQDLGRPQNTLEDLKTVQEHHDAPIVTEKVVSEIARENLDLIKNVGRANITTFNDTGFQLSGISESDLIAGLFDKDMIPLGIDEKFLNILLSDRERIIGLLDVDMLDISQLMKLTSEVSDSCEEPALPGNGRVHMRCMDDELCYGQETVFALSFTNIGDQPLYDVLLMAGVPQHTQFDSFMQTDGAGYISRFNEKQKTLFWKLYIPLQPGETFIAVFKVRLDPWLFSS